MEITDVSPDDAAAIAEIYRHAVDGSFISFEDEAPDAAAIADRITEGGRRPWIVAREGRRVLGYAYATPFRARAAYRHTVESTIYVAPNELRRGVATALMTELHRRLLAGGAHTVVAAIALPNPGSVALAESLGYRHVGTLPEAGYKLDRWIDVGFWAKPL